jgi:hypothetical protein
LDSFPFLFFRVQFKRKFLPLLCQVFYNDSAHQDKFRFNPAMQRARQKNLSDGLRAALNAAVPIGFVPPGSAVMASKRRRDLSDSASFSRLAAASLPNFTCFFHADLSNSCPVRGGITTPYFPIIHLC